MKNDIVNGVKVSQNRNKNLLYSLMEDFTMNMLNHQVEIFGRMDKETYIEIVNKSIKEFDTWIHGDWNLGNDEKLSPNDKKELIDVYKSLDGKWPIFLGENCIIEDGVDVDIYTIVLMDIGTRAKLNTSNPLESVISKPEGDYTNQTTASYILSCSLETKIIPNRGACEMIQAKYLAMMKDLKFSYDKDLDMVVVEHND